MKTVLLAAAATIVLVSSFTLLPVHAQESPVMTEEQISHIRSNCQSAVATLNRIHANDAPVYVNRNQAYFSISDKLMARLNGRLALNRFDTSPLVKISSEYTTALAQFRAAYKKYDESMTSLVRMNCNKQPVSFYDKVTESRTLRAGVQQSVKKLHTKIDEYREAVGVFQTQNQSKLKGNSNG